MLKQQDTVILTKQNIERLKETELFGFTEGQSGTLFAKRWDRHSGQMCIKWNNGRVTNCIILDKLDIEYDKPKFELIPLEQAPDKILSTTEKVQKRLLYEEGLSKREMFIRDKIFMRIVEIMGDVGCVFYEP